MSIPPDLLEGLVSYLRADTDLAGLVSARIYRPELPATDAAVMPRACVVLTLSGGGVLVGGNSYVEYADQRVDVAAYGGAPGEASDVNRAVWVAMKQLRRVISEGALIHWAIPEQAPIYLRDPDTDWPSFRTSWQVLISEVEVS